MNKKQIIEETLEGNEIWTDAFGDRFGERVCVLVKEGLIFHCGMSFKPTLKELKQLSNDQIIQEYGSIKEYRRQLEEEFGTKEVKV